MRWFWRLSREWRQREEKARQEAERSRRNLEETRIQAAPLKGYRDVNHFAIIIRDSLQLKNGSG